MGIRILLCFFVLGFISKLDAEWFSITQDTALSAPIGTTKGITRGVIVQGTVDGGKMTVKWLNEEDREIDASHAIGLADAVKHWDERFKATSKSKTKERARAFAAKILAKVFNEKVNPSAERKQELLAIRSLLGLNSVLLDKDELLNVAIGHLSMLESKYDEAVDAFAKLPAIGDPVSQLNLGCARYHHAGTLENSLALVEYSKSIDAYTNALQQVPEWDVALTQRAAAHRALAHIHQILDQAQPAEENHEKAMRDALVASRDKGFLRAKVVEGNLWLDEAEAATTDEDKQEKLEFALAAFDAVPEDKSDKTGDLTWKFARKNRHWLIATNPQLEQEEVTDANLKEIEDGFYSQRVEQAKQLVKAAKDHPTKLADLDAIQRSEAIDVWNALQTNVNKFSDTVPGVPNWISTTTHKKLAIMLYGLPIAPTTASGT